MYEYEIFKLNYIEVYFSNMFQFNQFERSSRILHNPQLVAKIDNDIITLT